MQKSIGFTEKDMHSQAGKCFVVTGANTGIGFEISRALATQGARVLLACRDQVRADEAMDRIRQYAPNADLAFLRMDLSDLNSVRDAVKAAEDEPHINVVINNAGVMVPPLSRTKQGFELQFGVNHLGSFALSTLLLPKLKEVRDSRIVTTSSIAHRGASIDWEDINAEKSYDRMKRYAASKLANALFFFELDRRLRAVGSQVTSIGCHPGMAATELGRHMGPLQILNPLVRVVLNSAEKGAWPALQAGTSAITPGAYYGPIGFGGVRGVSGEAKRSTEALNLESAQRLWDLSVEMTGIEPALTRAA